MADISNIDPMQFLRNTVNSVKQNIGPKIQGPKLTRGQQELQDFRNFKTNQVQQQVNADAAAGGKAMKAMKGKASSAPTSAAPSSLALPKGTAMGMTIASLIPKQAYDRVANEIVRGAVTVFGGDTTLMDARISGKPLVKSVGGTDFNVATNEGMAAYRKALAADPKKVSGGLNTDTGKIESKPPKEVKTYDSFQEQQDALMGNLGITTSPFSSTQLAYTSDSPYSQFPTGDDIPDLGIDPSKMLSNIDTEKVAELYNNPDSTTSFRITDDEAYSSPVNLKVGPGSGDPMLNPKLTSMQAMRVKDRDLGLMYASGQFFAEGKDGKPVLVNRELAKSVRRGDAGAADELAAYLTGDGVKPQGGVITDPDRSLMAPPKTEETQSTPTTGEFSSISAISPVDFTNTGALYTNLSPGFFNEEPAMPEMSKKLGLSYNNPGYTNLFSRKPDPSDPFSSGFNPYFFKD